MLDFFLDRTVDLWWCTMKLYLTLNVRSSETLDYFYLKEGKNNIEKNYVRNIIPIIWLIYNGIQWMYSWNLLLVFQKHFVIPIYIQDK